IERKHDQESDSDGNAKEGSYQSSLTGAPRRNMIPRTAVEFAEYYKKSKICEQNIRDMEDYKQNYVGKHELEEKYKESSRAEHARHTRRKVRLDLVLSSRQ